jgi:hypothetical protein
MERVGARASEGPGLRSVLNPVILCRGHLQELDWPEHVILDVPSADRDEIGSC